MGNIIPAERHVHVRFATLVMITALAVGLLALSWPRLQASIRYLPVERAIKAYYSTGDIPSARLPVLIRYAEAAITHHDHHRYHDGLSTLHLLRAMDYRTPALERREAYVAAMTEAERSLQRAPARPSTWLQLATVRWILHEEPETIIDAWKMSVFTGRMHSALFAKRAEIGLAHFANMDEEGMTMLRDQLLLAWQMRTSPLLQVVERRDRDLRVTRQLLASTDPVALAEIEAWLEKRRR